MMMAPTAKPLKTRLILLTTRHDRWMLPLLAAFVICPLAAVLVDPWFAIFMSGQRDTWLVKAAQGITDLGNAWRYLLGIAVLFAGSYLFRNASQFRARCLYVFATICASAVLTEALAFIIGRSRPRLFIEQGIYQLSLLSGFKPYDALPSSHASSVLAFAFAAAMVVPNARLALLVYGTVLAATRALINAHYVGDIVASAAIAGATALFLFRYLPEPRILPPSVISLRKAP